MHTVDLKTARTRRRLRQDDLAKKSGVDQSTISRIEKGGIKKPSPETVDSLEKALNLRKGSLVVGAPESAAS